MSRDNLTTQQAQRRERSRMPSGSFLFEKFIPAALLGMALVMLGLILFAAGVLLGVVSF